MPDTSPPHDGAVQLPKIILDALDPPGTLSVSAFLALPYAQQPPSIYDKEVISTTKDMGKWYSDEEPTENPGYIGQLHLPHPKTALYVGDGLDAALARGCRSIRHPFKSDVKWPLWTAKAFRIAQRLHERRGLWARRLDWVEEASSSEDWELSFTTRVRTQLNSSPWSSGLPGLQRKAVPAHHFSELLSESWLSSDTLDCMLDVVRADCGPVTKSKLRILVADSFLGQAICANPRSSIAKKWGNKLTPRATIYFPINVANAHWIAAGFNAETSMILFGDSLPQFSKAHMRDIIQKVKAWIAIYLPVVGRLRVNLTGITVASQEDGSSCGVAAVNGIHLAVSQQEVPAWCQGKAMFVRAYYFARCIELGLENTDIECMPAVSSSLRADQCSKLTYLQVTFRVVVRERSGNRNRRGRTPAPSGVCINGKACRTLS